MVPVYAVCSFLALVLPHKAVYFDTVRVMCAPVCAFHYSTVSIIAEFQNKSQSYVRGYAGLMQHFAPRRRR